MTNTTKRPAVNWLALTSETAAPMPEAAQRSAPPSPAMAALNAVQEVAMQPPPQQPKRVTTANLEGLAFKVPPSFRRRFRSRAAEASLKLNELLFQALDAWEREQSFKK